MTALILHRSSDAAALAAELAGRLGGVRADPFELDVVVTPHPHLRRWLTDELAHRLGRPGEGVCAGVSFRTPARLLRDLDDPTRFWHPRRLAGRLLQVLEKHPQIPELAQLHRHLQGSRTRYAVAQRIATLFARYLQWRPGLVEGWEAGRDCDERGVALGFDVWQPVLWRLAAADGSPLAASREFFARLRGPGALLPLPAAVSFVQPDPVSPWWAQVLHALAETREVHVSLRQVTAAGWPAALPSGPAARLTAFESVAHAPLGAWGRSELVPAAAPAPTTLGWLHRQLRGEPGAAAPAPDGSVQVHGGHGLERQVEILRDAITGLLAADPTLEPRHIVVGCPDLAGAAPLVQAAFRLPSGVPGRHPANDFRVQLADRSSAQLNPMLGVVVRVLRLVASRAGATDVLDLCAQPAVAARFGFEPDTLERLARLAADAGVRWGLSAAHRAEYGLGELRQNTWSAGLQRMLLGVALSEQHLPAIGTVLPLDDVEDGDLVPLGGLAELLSRLARLAAETEAPALLEVWVARLQRVLDEFALALGDDAWQRTDALVRLAELADRGAGGAALTLAEVTDLVAEEFEQGEARSTFGNGSLTVCSLRSLRGVPYRAVCLFGLDDGVFPRSAERDGDDLLLRDPRPGEPDAVAQDRQALADAVTAAGERLVLVYQARSAQTNEAVPPPAALADLLDLLAAGGVQPEVHPLQPFSPRLFGAGRPPVSFDPAGLRGATAVTGEPRATDESLTVPPAGPVTELALDDLVALVTDPVRHFLRERCGLSGWEPEPARDEIPIELGSLERWSIGDRLLGLSRSGHPLDEAVRAEWLRGAVPPGALGTRAVDDLARRIPAILAALPVPPGEPVTHHDIAVDVGSVRLTGRVPTQDDLVVQATFSKISPRRLIRVWLQLLALSAADDRPWQGALVGRGGRMLLQGPGRADACAALGRLIRLYRIGLDAPLPLPVELGATFAEYLEAGRDPIAERANFSKQFRREAKGHWQPFYRRVDDLFAVPLGADDLDQPTEGSLALAAARVLWFPVQTASAGRP